jgi:iron(III) transport system permease protein
MNANPVKHDSVRRWAGRGWRRLWRDNPPSIWLLFLTLPTVLITAIPLLYILVNARQGGVDTWIHVLSQRVPRLLWNTVRLAAVVTFASVFTGTALALLIARTDLPGRRWWRLLLALPLVIPPYVGALTFIITVGPRGWLTRALGFPLFPLYGSLFGTGLVLTLFCYPYAYLIVLSALRRMGGNLEEAARSCGLSRRQVLLKAILPVLRPATGAAALLIALYVISDFGAVAMLRYDTFVSSIYYQITGRFDRSAASVLATLLILITLTLLYLEMRTRHRFRFSSDRTIQRQSQQIPLGKWKIPALISVLLLFISSVVLPFAVMGYGSIEGIRQGALDSRFVGFMLNSLFVAGVTALACTGTALPLVYLRSRHAAIGSNLLNQAVMLNYALPGVIIALGLISFFSRYFTFLYATPWLVVTACFIRFLPHSLQAATAAMHQMPPRLDEAGRSLGLSSLHVLRSVLLPGMMPSLLAGGSLVFVSTLKELPATLLLRPPGFDTLAVRIWSEAHEGFYTQAAPAALLILIVSILPLNYLMKGD